MKVLALICAVVGALFLAVAFVVGYFFFTAKEQEDEWARALYGALVLALCFVAIGAGFAGIGALL